MRTVSSRTLLWIGRFLYVAAALWWPTVWRDPIYTPRQARMAGQELRLADGSSPKNDDERALAIFWAWEHRQFVETRWVVGPFLGLRSTNRAGWQQTIFVLIVIWLSFGFLLGRRSEGAAPAGESSDAPSTGRVTGLATIPLWQLFRRLRQQH